MIKHKNNKTRQAVVLIGTIAILSLFVVSAWATTISFINFDGQNTNEIAIDKIKNIRNVRPIGDVQPLPIAIDPEPTTRSVMPEPSTIALFGSGLLGMIVSFIRKTYATTKRVLDMIAGILGIVLLSPLFLATAILIKLTSKGPVFYKQIRVGKDGKNFWIYKFRTMKVDAEKDSGPVWASENDSRYIPCAKFLRKAHIDEIPQFYNILKGDMSLIGPRPERPVFVEQFKKEIDGYEKRLQVKPGLTGLAQVWHRYDETIEDVKKKIKYDLLYIKKMCLWTDLRIFSRTFRVVLTGEGAR